MPKKKGKGKFQGGGSKVLERGPVEVRRTLYDNGTVSYDGDHNGAKWRLVYRADDTVRLHFTHASMRVFRTMYGGGQAHKVPKRQRGDRVGTAVRISCHAGRWWRHATCPTTPPR